MVANGKVIWSSGSGARQQRPNNNALAGVHLDGERRQKGWSKNGLPGQYEGPGRQLLEYKQSITVHSHTLCLQILLNSLSRNLSMSKQTTAVKVDLTVL